MFLAGQLPEYLVASISRRGPHSTLYHLPLLVSKSSLRWVRAETRWAVRLGGTQSRRENTHAHVRCSEGVYGSAGPGAWWVQKTKRRRLLHHIRVLSQFSRVRLFATLWIVAPLPIGFSRQEYWSGLPLPTSGDLPHSPGFPVGCLFLLQINNNFKNPTQCWELQSSRTGQAREHISGGHEQGPKGSCLPGWRTRVLSVPVSAGA